MTEYLIFICIVSLLLIGFVLIRWIYPYYLCKIKTDLVNELYDFLLSQDNILNKNIILRLGVKNANNLNDVISRVKKTMELDYCTVQLNFHPQNKPPAFIRQSGNNFYEVSLSHSLKDSDEKLGALIHELGHIYISKFDVPSKYDSEKLVDCACILLGFGIYLLNNITDIEIFIPLPIGLIHQYEKRFFGYLRPEQFGYLFARYIVENQVAIKNIRPFLNEAGYRYFKIGLNYLKREHKYSSGPNRINGIYGCYECETFLRFPINNTISHIKCPNCKNSYQISN